MDTEPNNLITMVFRLMSRFSAGPIRDESDGHEHQLLVVIGLITVPFSLLYVAVSYFIGFHIGVKLMLVCFVLLLAILAVFTITGRFRLCANIYLATCFFVAILGCSYNSGGIHSMVTAWFTLIPVTSVLLLHLRVDTIIWTLLTCTVLLLYGVAHMVGFHFPVLYDSRFTEFFHMSTIIGLAIILWLIAFAFGRNRSIAMATIVEQKAELQHAMNEIEHLAYHDPLTELPNRRLFMERLGMTLAESKRNDQYAAVFYLDLDNFKSLNDTHGHEIGDSLLTETARRLRGCLREVDTLARLGGDEFAVIVGSLDADFAASKARVSIIAEKIAAALAEPYFLLTKTNGPAQTAVTHHSAASIGVALFKQQKFTSDEILNWSDKAMYRAKSSGKNAVCYCSVSDSRDAECEFELI